jgi:micrococcal nuclease
MNLKALLILITISLTFSVNAKDKNYGDVKVLEVTSIYDGDTFRANIESYPPVIGKQ